MQPKVRTALALLAAAAALAAYTHILRNYPQTAAQLAATPPPPRVEGPLTVLKMETLDEQGRPRRTLPPGTRLTLKATIYIAYSAPGHVLTVQAQLERNGEPLIITREKRTVLGGELVEIRYGIPLPNQPGTYTLKLILTLDGAKLEKEVAVNAG